MRPADRPSCLRTGGEQPSPMAQPRGVHVPSSLLAPLLATLPGCSPSPARHSASCWDVPTTAEVPDPGSGCCHQMSSAPSGALPLPVTATGCYQGILWVVPVLHPPSWLCPAGSSTASPPGVIQQEVSTVTLPPLPALRLAPSTASHIVAPSDLSARAAGSMGTLPPSCPSLSSPPCQGIDCDSCSERQGCWSGQCHQGDTEELVAPYFLLSPHCSPGPPRWCSVAAAWCCLLTSLRTEKHPEQGRWGRCLPPMLSPCGGKGRYQL